MDKAGLKEMEDSFDLSARAHRQQVNDMAEARGIEVWEARQLVRTMNMIGMVAGRIAETLGVRDGPDAMAYALELRGDMSTERYLESALEHGLGASTLAAAYLSLQRASSLADSGDYLSALSSMSQITYSIVFGMEELGSDKYANAGAKGGSTTAAHWERVAAEAVRLARSLGLDDGQTSAENAAATIEEAVRAFARKEKQDFPGRTATRKIAQYLRAAGIKKTRGVRTP